MKKLVQTMESLSDEETVQLYSCTALTNLAHNSLENRGRYILYSVSNIHYLIIVCAL